MADSDRVILGHFGAPHGIRGEVRLHAYAEEPLGLGDYGPLTLDDGRTVEIASIRAQGDGLIARIKGIADRDAAQTLRNRRFFVPRAALPPLEEDDFYHADLVGLAARLEDGTLFGRVVAIQNFGAGDLVELMPEGGRSTVLLPFTRAVVPIVDSRGGFLVVVPPPEVEARPPDVAQDDAEQEDEASVEKSEGLS